MHAVQPPSASSALIGRGCREALLHGGQQTEKVVDPASRPSGAPWVRFAPGTRRREPLGRPVEVLLARVAPDMEAPLHATPGELMGRRGAQGSGIRCARIQRSRSRVNRSRTAGTGQSRLGREPETDRPLESSFIEPIHTENAVFVFSRCVAALISEMSLEYNIAGPADDEDYAQAEYLAEMLMVSLPSIKCNLIRSCRQLERLCLREVWLLAASSPTDMDDQRDRGEGYLIGTPSAKKYGLRVTGVEFSAWPKVAAENHAAKKKRRTYATLVGSKEEGRGVRPGDQRGASVGQPALSCAARVRRELRVRATAEARRRRRAARAARWCTRR